MGYCKKCGTINASDAKYCRNCGQPLEQEHKSSGRSAKPILIVLSLVSVFGVLYALKGGFRNSNNDEESRLYDETTAIAEEGNGKLPAPVQKLLDDMVYVEGGSFMMLVEKKLDEDDPDYQYPGIVHIEERATVSSFYICKYEVTQELWMSVMGNNPSHWSKERGYPDDLQRPVENVSFKDCQVFIEKLNELTGKYFRLPSCAEWQYAAKGGNRSKGYKYAGSNNLDEVAWIPEIGEDFITHPVGKKKGNELKLYDMNGNVSEVVSDRLYLGDAIYQYTCGSSIQSVLAKMGDEIKVNDFYTQGLTVRDGKYDGSGDMFIGLRLAMADED